MYGIGHEPTGVPARQTSSARIGGGSGSTPDDIAVAVLQVTLGFERAEASSDRNSRSIALLRTE
jgi:hypothetical protein